MDLRDSHTGTGAAAPPRPLRNGCVARGAGIRGCLSAAAAFAAVKVLGLSALVVYSTLRGESAHVLLSARWDALWYVRITEHGYGVTVAAEDGRVLSDLAFFPLYPAAEKLVATLFLLPPGDAGLLVSAVAGALAAAGIYAVVVTFAPHRAALLTAVLWAACPVAVVQSMAYSESLFTALAAWALYCTRQRRWTTSGVLACAAGLTRPVGVAVALAVWTAVGCAARRTGWTWRHVAACVLAPAGYVGYLLWVGGRTGGLLGYLDVQREWGNGFDAGLSFCLFLARLLDGPAFPAGLALLLGVVGLGLAYLAGLRQGYPLPVQVYTGVVVLLAMGTSGYFGSKPRLLIPAFALLVPVAALLVAAPRGVRWAVLTALCAVSAGYGAVWLNGTGPP